MLTQVEVLAERDLWIGEMRQVVVGSRRVLVLRTERGVYACEDRCPHLGVPLSRGTLERDTLTCSAHHYAFDANTGEGKNPRHLHLETIGVECRAGKIFLGIDPGGNVGVDRCNGLEKAAEREQNRRVR
jgi:toluene monooxygenase system ferredoxin subunit